MKNKKLFIYGVGRLAEYAAYVFEKDSIYEVQGFCIEQNYIDLNPELDPAILSFESLQDSYQNEEIILFIAVGNNKLRENIFIRAIEMGYDLASYISSQSSHWENLQVGKNVFIDEGCVLQPFISIANNSILFTSQIGHHTQIGNNVLISGAKTGGNVSIGDNCYIGLNASIKQNIKIAANTIIGMGCLIEKDVLQASVYSHKGTTKRNLDPVQISKLFLR